MIRIFKGEVQRLFPILEAIKEGKTIQFHLPDGWRDVDGDDEGFYLETLIGESDKYRIKPEPKYRSFKNAEECLDEMLKHQPFGWIKTKGGGYFNILSVDDYYAGLADKDGSAILLASKNSYQDNTFYDGTPFGIKVEE